MSMPWVWRPRRRVAEIRPGYVYLSVRIVSPRLQKMRRAVSSAEVEPVVRHAPQLLYGGLWMSSMCSVMNLSRAGEPAAWP